MRKRRLYQLFFSTHPEKKQRLDTSKVLQTNQTGALANRLPLSAKDKCKPAGFGTLSPASV